MNELPGQPAPTQQRRRLRRLRENLLARDWVGVAVEIAIVAIGVLLAFQIDQWGERRNRAEAERQFLERLYSEYRRGLTELDFVDRYHMRMRSEIRAVFDARNDPAQLAIYQQKTDFGCGAARFRAAPFNDTAFEELLSSGRLNMVSDQQLRGEIRDLATAQAAAEKQVQYGRELVLNQLSELGDYYRFDIATGGKTICHIEWARLLEDPRAVNTIVRAYRVHLLALEERLKVKRLTERLLQHLACKLDKPECKV